MTPRERAESLKKLVTVDIHQDFWDSIRQQIEQAILADRQALQSELEKRLRWLRKQDCEKYIAYEEMIDVIQSVFAQQSKPFSVFKPAATYFISKAECMRRISADRQALQSELEGLIEQYKSCFLPFTTERIIIIKCLEKIQSVFAQQSQPEEGKPDTGYDPSVIRVTSGDGQILYQRPEGWTSESECQMRIKAESDRRVLAEREACAKLADERMLACLKAASDFPEGSRLHTQASEWAEEDKIIAGQIRARSNQPEGKQCGNTFRNLYGQQRQCTLPAGHDELHMNTEFDPECSTCVYEAKEEAEANADAKKNVSAIADLAIPDCWHPDRISMLYESLAIDVKIIQQLNESNMKLMEENEKLTQRLEIHEAHHRLNCDGPGYCTFKLCSSQSPATRKA